MNWQRLCEAINTNINHELQTSHMKMWLQVPHSHHDRLKDRYMARSQGSCNESAARGPWFSWLSTWTFFHHEAQMWLPILRSNHLSQLIIVPWWNVASCNWLSQEKYSFYDSVTILHARLEPSDSGTRDMFYPGPVWGEWLGTQVFCEGWKRSLKLKFLLNGP